MEKYEDYDMSPEAEAFDKILYRYEQPWTTYYFIISDNTKVDAIRVIWTAGTK